MVKLKKTPPVDYSKCNQTVTVYHNDGTSITRKVYTRAFFDFRKNENVDKTGSTETNSALLVIPAFASPAGQPVSVGDKVVLGSGPVLADRAAWASFIPAKVPNMIVVRYVDPKYWAGSVAHYEAGG